MQESVINYIDDPVEIAPKIWWVGHVLDGDPFQCHVYLIDNGKDSILFDSLCIFEIMSQPLFQPQSVHFSLLKLI